MTLTEVLTNLRSYAQHLPADQLANYNQLITDIAADYTASNDTAVAFTALQDQHKSLEAENANLRDTALRLFMTTANQTDQNNNPNNTDPDPDGDDEQDPTVKPIDEILNTMLGKEDN